MAILPVRRWTVHARRPWSAQSRPESAGVGKVICAACSRGSRGWVVEARSMRSLESAPWRGKAMRGHARVCRFTEGGVPSGDRWCIVSVATPGAAGTCRLGPGWVSGRQSAVITGTHSGRAAGWQRRSGIAGAARGSSGSSARAGEKAAGSHASQLTADAAVCNPPCVGCNRRS